MVNSTINTKNFTSDDFDFVPMFVFVFDTDSYKLPPSIQTSITKTKNVECEPTFKIIAQIPSFVSPVRRKKTNH
jgi:hypothetical protein